MRALNLPLLENQNGQPGHTIDKNLEASAKENNFILIKKTHVKTEWDLQ
jgi:hypothetical protein